MSTAKNPIVDAQTPNPDRLLPKKAESSFDATLSDWVRWFGEIETEIQQVMTSAYGRTRDAVESWMTETRVRTRKLQQERPLTLLGIIAGSAFAAGIGLAVWKSRRS